TERRQERLVARQPREVPQADEGEPVEAVPLEGRVVEASHDRVVLEGSQQDEGRGEEEVPDRLAAHGPQQARPRTGADPLARQRRRGARAHPAARPSTAWPRPPT